MAAANVRRDGDALVFTGALLRDAVPALWKQASASLDGARRLDLGACDRLDSAGLALVAELAARIGAHGGPAPAIVGAPVGLTALREAYRLDENLAFATS